MQNIPECSHCGRTFPNGQALGGHMSIHTYPGRHMRHHPSASGRSGNSASSSNSYLICNHCAKTFSAKKGLKAHIRSRHPLEHATQLGRSDEFRRAELASANEVSRNWSSNWNQGDFDAEFSV